MIFLRYRITYYIFIYHKFNQKIFPKIKFILGNNAVESPRIELGSKQANKLLSTRLVFN